jgi:dTDP-N-acetylfucosamine:lipid II N-acetylfucosaminyltransferase
MILDKFMAPFIDFVKFHFNSQHHKFIFVTSEKYQYGLLPSHDVAFLHTDKDIEVLERYMLQSSKVILHGLWRDKVDALLTKNKDVLKKCYWIMWGGDFYFPNKQSEIRKTVIRNVGFLVTANSGDVKYVRQYYQAQGQHIDCISYLSNVFYDVSTQKKTTDFINVQVGNSAAENNKHKQVFETLAQLNTEKIKVYCPLSYGSSANADEVSRVGENIFGNRFIALRDFWHFDEYREFLFNMDYAIFDAERQQGFGNTLYLLGMGKKVFLNEKSNIHQYFSDLGIKVYDTANIELSPLDLDIKNQNMERVRQYFSEQNLLESLKKWLD